MRRGDPWDAHRQRQGVALHGNRSSRRSGGLPQGRPIRPAQAHRQEARPLMTTSYPRNVRQAAAAASPAAGLVPARSGPAGPGRGPRPDPAAAPALDYLKRGGLPRDGRPREENRERERPEGARAARAAEAELPAVQHGRRERHQRHRVLKMQPVRAGHADTLREGEDGDDAPAPRRTSAPPTRPKPMPMPPPWVTSPREVPFQTGEPT